MAHEPQNVAESIRVRVPSRSASASSSSSSRRGIPNCCGTHAIDCCSAKLMSQNHGNHNCSEPPARFMYFNHDGSWLDFPPGVLSSLRSAFLERKPLIDLSICGSRYVFDFLRMLQTDFESGCRRSIAWIDEKGKCFFPKAFVGDDFDDKLEKLANPKIEIEIQIDNNNSVKRKREETNKEEPEVSSSMKQEQDDVLKRQRLNLPDVGTSRWPNARLLTEGEKVFSMVRDVFLSGMRKVDPGATITALHQCMHEGHLEKARYEVFQKQIEITRAARNASNTVYAWHGASAKGVETILEDGFGLPSNVSAPEGYGIGVYLSPLGLPHISAKMSQMDGNGEKHVLLCRVILGNVEKVEAGSQQNCPSSMDFDTGADEPNNPKWYVVWSSNMSRHIIPECVVSFKSSRHVQGQVKGPICMKYSFDKLFSKMRNLLPPTKIQEVVSIYDKFRAGALARHMFVKQLRLIAGDEVLLSIIREIHGPE